MKKYYFIFNEGSKVNQWICAIMINLPTLMYGMAVGWMSPMTLLLQSSRSPAGEPLSDIVVSWMASVSYLVCIPADFLFAYLEEKWGRKFALICMSSSMVACWTLKLVSMEVWAFVLARAMFGFCMAAACVVSPTYTREVSEDSNRGTLGSLGVLAQTSGNLVLYVLGDLLSYRAVLWSCLALPALHILLFAATMPDSPSYLYKSGQHEAAARALAWLRCRRADDELVVRELDDIRREQERDREGSKFAFKAIMKEAVLRRAFWIVMVTSLGREACGANPVLNFAGYIFELAAGAGGGGGGGTGGAGGGGGALLTPNQQAMALGAVQVCGAALASSLVESTGRKPLLIVTSLVSGLGMCALGSWFLARQAGLLAPGWVPITSLCLCIFCDAAGLQPISMVILNEIFSFKYRSTVSAVAMACSAAADFVQLLVFRRLAGAVGLHCCFYLFGAVCLLVALYVLLVVPETKTRALHEIYEHLKTKKERAAEKENRDVELQQSKELR